MPLVAVPSVKLGVTVRPPGTALLSTTAKVIRLPSCAQALPISAAAPSSSMIVPVAVSVAVTAVDVPETDRLTVNVSCSPSLSAVVATVKVWVSPAVPAKMRAVVLAV